MVENRGHKHITDNGVIILDILSIIEQLGIDTKEWSIIDSIIDKEDHIRVAANG